LKERHADKREGCACVSEGEGARAKQQLAANVLHNRPPLGSAATKQAKQGNRQGKQQKKKKL